MDATLQDIFNVHIKANPTNCSEPSQYVYLLLDTSTLNKTMSTCFTSPLYYVQEIDVFLQVFLWHSENSELQIFNTTYNDKNIKNINNINNDILFLFNKGFTIRHTVTCNTI